MKNVIKLHNPSLQRKDLEYVLESMIHDNLEYGVIAKNLETKLCEKINAKYAIAVNSLYTAIDSVIEALGLIEGDEVIIPSFAPVIYLDVILKHKLTPVIIDLANYSFFPGVEQIQNAITDRTKLLIIIHHFGYTIDLSAFKPIVPFILEDISKVIGATAGTLTAGSYGTYSIASFDSSEIITTGDGAIVIANSKKDYSVLNEKLYNKTFNENEYSRKIHGLMPDMNAAMGLSQLHSLEKRLVLRKKIGTIFEEALLKGRSSIIPSVDGCERHYINFPILLKSGIKDAIAFFKKNGVLIDKPFPLMLHHYLKLDKEAYPNTEKIYLSTILIPINSTLLKTDVELISKLLISML